MCGILKKKKTQEQMYERVCGWFFGHYNKKWLTIDIVETKKAGKSAKSLLVKLWYNRSIVYAQYSIRFWHFQTVMCSMTID